MVRRSDEKWGMIALFDSVERNSLSPVRPMHPDIRLARARALLLAPLLFGCSRKENNQEGAPPPVSVPSIVEADADSEVPAAAQDKLTQSIGGQELIGKIQDSGAKGTIVNAWASWCGPCRREFPMLVALRDSLSAEGIAFVFVSVDEPETSGAAVDFATTRGVQAPIFIAERPLGPFKNAMSPKWPGMLPATFLFDELGELRYFWGGPVYEEELLPVLERYLAGDDVDGYAKVPLRRGKDFRQD